MDLAAFAAYDKHRKSDELGAAIAFGMLDGYRLVDLAQRLQSDAAISNLLITDCRISYDRDGSSINFPIRHCHCGEVFAYSHDRYGAINPKTLRQPVFSGARECNVCQLRRKRAASRHASWLHRRRSGQVKAGVAECQHCGDLFDQERSTAKFCSTKCRVAAHRASKRT